MALARFSFKISTLHKVLQANSGATNDSYGLPRDCRWWWWLLLYSAILRYRADSLRSHVILHEWLYGFLKRAFEYPPKWCTYNAGMAGATWNCCRLCASSVYTIQPCTMSFYAKPHTLGVCESSCNLPHALLAEWSRYFTCYCGNTGVERIPK